MIFEDFQTFIKNVNVQTYIEISDPDATFLQIIKQLLERGWKIEVPAKDLVKTYK